MTDAKLPPGPSESAFSQAAQFGKDPYGHLEACARRYGDLFTVRLPGRPPHVVFGEPDLVRQAFALAPEAYEAHVNLIPFNIGRGSLLFLDDEPHRRDRQVLMPRLHGDRSRGFAAIIQQAADEVLGGWSAGSRVGLKEALQDISLRAVLRCFFGAGDRERAARLGDLFVTWMKGTFTPLHFLAGILLGAARFRNFLDDAAERSRERGGAALSDRLPWNRGPAAKGQLLSLLREDFERCRREGAPDRGDVLAQLAEARYEDGALLPVDSAVDEIMTLMVAGYDSTSTALTWALSYMLPRPDVMAAVAEELQRVYGGGPVDPQRTGELVYLEACIKEALRIAPPAPTVSRLLRRPLSFGGYDLPAGTILWPCVYLTHHRADLWPEPDRYRPERFLSRGPVPSHHYYPFGGGRRACTGISFANLEMRVVLAQLLTRHRLRLAQDRPVRPAFRGQFVAPADEVYVVVEETRRGAPTPAAVAS